MKILLGLSGGVDSTYAALKLKNEGHDVHGAVVLMHAYTDTEGAALAASEVGIPLHVIDASSEFENTVCSNFVSEYTSGRTPNPCVLCNREIKFKSLMSYAIENGFDAISTGHYARVCSTGEGADMRYYIAMARDKRKDQSYMLSALSQEELSMLVLPMGDELKSDITVSATALGLSAAKKEESQEICFIPDGKYTEYIEARAGASLPGDFIDSFGAPLGRHKGIIHYTVGQRKGLEIALGKRVFVTEINSTDNTVMLEDKPRCSSVVRVGSLIFSKISSGDGTLRLTVKLRYLAAPCECDVNILGDEAIVRLAEPQPSVTPGQCAAFYDGDACVMSGIIVKAE